MCLVWNAATVIRTEGDVMRKTGMLKFLKPGEAVDYHVDIKLYQK